MNQQEVKQLSEGIEKRAIAENDQLDNQFRDQFGEGFVDLGTALPEMDRSMRDLVAAIGYGQVLLNAPRDLPARLKERLFQRVQQEQEVLELIRSCWDNLRWKPHPVKGLRMAIIKIDRSQREISSLVRADETVDYPLHHHATGEEILMLRGEFIDQDITYRTGDYLCSPAGSCHAPKAIEGCLFFVKTSLDDKFL